MKQFEEWKLETYGVERNSGYDQFKDYAESAWQASRKELLDEVIKIMKKYVYQQTLGINPVIGMKSLEEIKKHKEE